MWCRSVYMLLVVLLADARGWEAADMQHLRVVASHGTIVLKPSFLPPGHRSVLLCGQGNAADPAGRRPARHIDNV